MAVCSDIYRGYNIILTIKKYKSNLIFHFLHVFLFIFFSMVQFRFQFLRFKICRISKLSYSLPPSLVRTFRRFSFLSFLGHLKSFPVWLLVFEAYIFKLNLNSTQVRNLLLLLQNLLPFFGFLQLPSDCLLTVGGGRCGW